MSPLPPDANANIARHLTRMASRQPAQPALKIPRGRTHGGDIDYLVLTFAELGAEVNAWAARLTAAGVQPGDRTLVMVRQGLPLIASAFALFQVGAVPVVIDPGMGLRSFLGCVHRSQPRALVGIPLARVISRLFPRAFRSIAVRVPAPNALTARLTQRAIPDPKLETPIPTASTPNSELQTPNSELQAPNSELQTPNSILRTPYSELRTAPRSGADLAAILFTSGSTGAPKGVCYEHGMFEAQIRIIRDTYAIAPGEIDLPLLPIFALFNPALGLTTIVPEIDPRRPAAVQPARIVQAIRQEGVTNSFGSPTLWKKIGDHCVAQKITLPGLRRVLCAGAPVPAALWASSRQWMPNGRLHSPYGATEVLPVSSVSSDEILAVDARATRFDTRVAGGACVGRPVGGAQVKIIALTDTPIATLADARELPPGRIGEIIVSGPTVTRAYADDPVATAAAKISGSQLSTLSSQLGGGGAVLHRMGDCGYLDAEGRLWFCGRKAERVETAHGPLFTEPCEQVFRTHPRVRRCALIGFGERGHQRAALVVEVKTSSSHDRRALARELRELARAHPQTELIDLFYFHPRFPVDVRHNAKIHRLALARWAATARGYHSDPKR